MDQYIPVVNKTYICLLANSFGKSVKSVYFRSIIYSIILARETRRGVIRFFVNYWKREVRNDRKKWPATQQPDRSIQANSKITSHTITGLSRV